MAITTYTQLKTAVAAWLNRSELSANVPDFISLAEARIFFGGAEPFKSAPLRVPAMQTRETGTISSSVIAFPTGFIELTRLSVVSGGRTYELTYEPPQTFFERQNEADVPTIYTFANGGIATAGTGSASYAMDYVAKLDSLSDSVATNWLLANAPNVYLYGALVESSPFVYDDPRVQTWFSMFKSGIEALNRNFMRPASGSLQVRVVK